MEKNNNKKLDNNGWRSEEWCVSSARADWLLAVCHSNLGDKLIGVGWGEQLMMRGTERLT